MAFLITFRAAVATSQALLGMMRSALGLGRSLTACRTRSTTLRNIITFEYQYYSFYCSNQNVVKPKNSNSIQCETQEPFSKSKVRRSTFAEHTHSLQYGKTYKRRDDSYAGAREDYALRCHENHYQQRSPLGMASDPAGGDQYNSIHLIFWTGFLKSLNTS